MFAVDGDLTRVMKDAFMEESGDDYLVTPLMFVEGNGDKEVNATILVKVPFAEVSEFAIHLSHCHSVRTRA